MSLFVFKAKKQLIKIFSNQNGEKFIITLDLALGILQKESYVAAAFISFKGFYL